MIDTNSYREQMKFDDPDTSTAQRAKYLLFFVTKISKLRNDMIPVVVVERLYDWGYDDVTADEIDIAFRKDPDVRPSRTRTGAYEITQPAETRIRKRLKSYESPTWHNTLSQTILVVLIMSLIVLFGLLAYHSATSKITVRELSFPEYRQRIGFDEANTTSADRAKYFLYFITEVIQLRADMSPLVVEERLNDIGYHGITAVEIEEAFLLDPDVQLSRERSGAFRINPLASDRFKMMLEIEAPHVEILTLGWLWRHIPVSGWIIFFVTFVAVISGAFRLGYNIALFRLQND